MKLYKYIGISCLMLCSCFGIEWKDFVDHIPIEQGHSIKHVVLVSVDGLRADVVRDNIEHLPSFQYLQQNGKYTYSARTDLYITATLPNHTGMVTGRFSRGDNGHKWTSNGSPGGGSINEDVLSVFDNIPSNALFSTKPKIRELFENSFPLAINYQGTQQQNTDSLIRVISRVEFAMIHYLKTDSIGHKKGFSNSRHSEYFYALSEIDEFIGHIINTLPPDGMLIITSDHGGGMPVANQHYSQNDSINYTIPLFIYHDGIGIGNLVDINQGLGQIHSMHICNFILKQLGENVINEGLQGLRIE